MEAVSEVVNLLNSITMTISVVVSSVFVFSMIHDLRKGRDKDELK